MYGTCKNIWLMENKLEFYNSTIKTYENIESNYGIRLSTAHLCLSPGNPSREQVWQEVAGGQ